VEDYRTKATLGITGWYCLSVHSDGSVRHLDVGSSYPGAGENEPSLPAGNSRVINKLKTVEANHVTCILQVPGDIIITT